MRTFQTLKRFYCFFGFINRIWDAAVSRAAGPKTIRGTTETAPAEADIGVFTVPWKRSGFGQRLTERPGPQRWNRVRTRGSRDVV